MPVGPTLLSEGAHRHPAIQLVTTSLAITPEQNCRCRRLHTLLEAKQVKFEVVDVAMEDGRFDSIATETGLRELPQVIVNGRLLGDFDQVQQLEDDGGLDSLLGMAPCE